MAKGDYRNNKSFEIEIPEDCDSQAVLQNIIGKMSRHRQAQCEDDVSETDDQEDVCTESESEDCMLDSIKRRDPENPKTIKKKHKDQAKKRKALKKECQKKAKEIIKDFKMKEKTRRRKEKERIKKIKRYEKQKDKEEKKCRKERMKCEKNKEKVRRAKEKEKLRTLKEKMKMKCDSLKYSKTDDCDFDDDDYVTCTNATNIATRDAKQKRQQKRNEDKCD